jgi:hypothetical protein
LLVGTSLLVPMVWSTGALLGRSGALAVALPFVLSAWSTSFVAAITWFAAFRCPHCRRHFHWTWIVANPLSRACLHCGFEKWRDPDAARAYRRR